MRRRPDAPRYVSPEQRAEIGRLWALIPSWASGYEPEAQALAAILRNIEGAAIAYYAVRLGAMDVAEHHLRELLGVPPEQSRGH